MRILAISPIMTSETVGINVIYIVYTNNYYTPIGVQLPKDTKALTFYYMPALWWGHAYAAIRSCVRLFVQYPGPDLTGGGLGPSSLGVTKWETAKSLKIKNAKLVSNKIMKGLVGGPLLVGGLGPGPPAPLP